MSTVTSQQPMRDYVMLILCAVCGAVALVLLVTLPIEIVQGPLEVEGRVVRVFHPAGLTIAHVQLDTPLSIVFMQGSNLSSGDYLRVNTTLAQYDGHLELIATPES